MRSIQEAYLENIPNEKLSLVIGAQNGKVCRIIVVFVTISQSFSFYRFYSTQSVNDDGTVSIQVGDKNAYFDHIACELHKVHQKYSDVNIVCQDGSTIVSNKAILCQSPEISALFHSQPDSWESKGTLYDFFKNPREIKIFFACRILACISWSNFRIHEIGLGLFLQFKLQEQQQRPNFGIWRNIVLKLWESDCQWWQFLGSCLQKGSVWVRPVLLVEYVSKKC